MGVIFMDGFDADDYVTKWFTVRTGTRNSIETTTSTRFSSGKAMKIGVWDVNDPYRIKKMFTPSSEIFVGFAINNLYTQVSTYFFEILGDGGSTLHLALKQLTSGSFGVYRSGTLLASAAYKNNVWQYIEVNAIVADTGGVVKVRVDGVEVISYTGDTRNGGVSTNIDAISLMNDTDANEGTTYLEFDDVYVCDSSGTINNTFLGDIRIQTLVPTAAGSSTQLTPTGSSNYANVADIPDSTATYNSSSTVGSKDLYALGDLASGTATVKCVQVNTRAWKDDAGTASLKVKIKSGSTEVAGATVALPSSVAWNGDVWETDPNTSTAWTVSAVNGLEAGAEVA